MFRTLAALAVVCAAATAAHAQALLIDVLPSVGPNLPGSGSPSYPGYAANAVTGLGLGGAAAGTPGTPTYYETVPNGGTISVRDILSTDFPSWRGTANPPPFDAEFGNRLYFGVRIVDEEGGGIRLSNLTYELTNTLDPTLNRAGSYAGLDYSEDRVGVIYGEEGPEFVTSGPGTQRVNEIRLVGQDFALERTAANFDDTGGLPPFGVTTKYTQFTPEREELQFEGSATVNVEPAAGQPQPIPAPPALALGLIAAAGLAARRRWRKT